MKMKMKMKMYTIPLACSLERAYDWILVRVLTEALSQEAQKTLTSGMKAFKLGKVSRKELGQSIFEGISKRYFVNEALSMIANWVKANTH